MPNNHIPTQNLYYNYYYPKPKYLIIGYMEPLGRWCLRNGRFIPSLVATSLQRSHGSCSQNSLKGVIYRGLYMGITIGVIKGDTRSLDYSSCGVSENQGPF